MHNNQIGLSHTKQKINSKWIKVLYVRLENRKVLKGNMGYTLFDISQMTQGILKNISPQARQQNAKVNKWNYIKAFAHGRKLPTK